MNRFIHISDTHLGKRQYSSNKRKKDYMKSFEDVIDMVIEEHKDNNVDAVIHTGDLFDSPHPELETVTECIDIIKKLDKYSIPFYMIVGNHERKRNKQWADLMNMIEEQVIRLSEDPIEFDNVRIYGIDAIRTPEWSTKDLTLEGDDDCFNLLCMHELVNPPVPKHMSDYSANKILERVELNIDLLALGDYHEDCIEKYNDTKIIYPGSTEKTKRSESKNHYVYLLEIDNNNELEIKRKLIEETREFVEVDMEFFKRDSIRKVEKILDSYKLSEKDPVLIVNLTGEDTGITSKQVRKKATEKGADIIRIIDKRNIEELEDIEVEDFEIDDIDSRIDEDINKLELSEEVREIESLIRDDEIKKSNIREKIRDKIEKGDNNEN